MFDHVIITNNIKNQQVPKQDRVSIGTSRYHYSSVILSRIIHNRHPTRSDL